MPKKILKERQVSSNLNKLTRLVGKVKVVYTDVDGTLLGPGGSLFLDSQKKYTLTPAKAIIKALEAGIDVVLVSGRSRLQLHGDARLMGLKNYLAELGLMLVYNLGEKVILNTGALEVGDKLPLEVMEEMGVARLLLSKYKGYLEHHTPWSERRECTYVFRGYVNVNDANKLLQSKGFSNLKFVDNGVIGSRGKNLRTGIPRLHAYHILPKGAGKANGVKKDQRIRKLKKSECIAIGDALSDLELAEEVGAFFLVKNALEEQPELKVAIKNYDNVFITNKKMGLGFAEIINFLLRSSLT